MTTSVRRPASWILVSAIALLAALLAAAPAAPAAVNAPSWATCGNDVPDVQCADVAVPLDYDRPDGATIDLHVARVPASDQANKLGVLFFNPGGPGGPAGGYLEAFGRNLFPRLNERYDIVAFDPRGTGASQGAIDCKANQETEGIYSQPFLTPENLDVVALLRKTRGYVKRCVSNNRPDLMSHFSTANAARDMDALRGALGEQRLNYLGFSYGTFIGATYATLFPRNYDRFVLDGPLDADQYINDPSQGLREQTSGFERALGRFLSACAANQDACSGFGGSDPWLAFDALIDKANATPLPATGNTADPRPVDGDDVINAAIGELYARQLWGELAYALALAEDSDGSAIRALSNDSYGRQDDGSYDPGYDRYFVLGAVEQRYGTDVRTYLLDGNRSWGQFDHFYLNAGYAELNYGLWPIHDRDAFYGPFEVRAGARTPLVVANTYDPATPYNGARRLVRDLGNARFLKVRADGHTAYGRSGPCADAAIDAYLLGGTLPAAGTVCDAVQPFTRFTPTPVPQLRREPLQRPLVPTEGRAQRHGLPARLGR
jgi:pimeloyl-ACP methyl ester carboxylesterase